MNKYLFIVLTASVMLASCEREEGSVPNEPASLLVKEVRAGSETGSATRAAATPELTSGSIGVFRAKDTGTSPVYPTECNNYKYTYSSGWKPADAANTICLTGKNIGVCAYYPHHAATNYNNKLALPLTSGRYTGANDTNDICYATERSVNASSTGRSTTFIMSHAMALLELVLYKEAGTSSLTVTNVTLSHASLINSATLNITNGTYTTVSAPGSLGYNPSLTVSGTSATTSALLVPFNLNSAGLKVTFTTTNVNTSSVTIPAASFGGKLEPGKRYRVKIALNGMEVTGGVEVTDWTNATINNGGNPYPI